MDTTSKVINTSDIVSSELKDIKLDQSFVDQYNIAEFDQDIIKKSVLADSGMTSYQCRQFVANSQITPYKRVRQSMMELEVRYHAYHEIKASLRKAEIHRLKWLQQKELMADPLDKELIQIDIDKNDYDITIWKRKLRQSEYEMKSFLEIIKEHVKTPEEFDYYLGRNDEEEKRYWIARMAKQASLDIIAFGRIGSGNMDSIAMMNQDEQLETLAMAVQYSGLINAGLHKISVETQDTVNKYLESSNTTIPDLLENSRNGYLQHTAQPKIKSETI